jgi:hypothetical protein
MPHLDLSYFWEEWSFSRTWLKWRYGRNTRLNWRTVSGTTRDSIEIKNAHTPLILSDVTRHEMIMIDSSSVRIISRNQTLIGKLEKRVFSSVFSSRTSLIEIFIFLSFCMISIQSKQNYLQNESLKLVTTFFKEWRDPICQKRFLNRLKTTSWRLQFTP